MNTQINTIINEFNSKAEFNTMILDALNGVALATMSAIADDPDQAESIKIDLQLLRRVCLAVTCK